MSKAADLIRRTRIEPRVKQAMIDVSSNPLLIKDYPKTIQFQVLEKFSEYYHARNKPLIEDGYFDKIEQILKNKYPRHAFFKKSGHKAVGNKRQEVKLPSPMPGLQQMQMGSAAFLKFFDDKKAKVIMDKLDGISLQIVYIDGVPKEAYTRGDSTQGQDISHILPHLRIPRKIPVRGRFGVRTEAIISPSAFDRKHNKETSSGKFGAARNMVGGVLLKQTSSKDYDVYKGYAGDIDVVCYEIVEGASASKTISKQLEVLKKLKFKTVWYSFISNQDKESLSSIYASRIKACKYEMDGIVVMKDIVYTRASSLPKHAFKFKENSESAMQEVKVLRVEWETSRTNNIIPTVAIKPIRLGGVQVSNFLGHSLFYIQNGFKKSDIKKNLPVRPIGPGAVLKVVRSGNVIPYIVQVIKAAPKGAQLPDIPYKVSGVHAKYSGTDKEPKIKRLAHFFIRLGLDGYKLSTFAKLYDAGYRTPSRIMKLDVEDISRLDKMGDNSARGLVSEVSRVTNKPSFIKFVDATGYLKSFGQERVQYIVDEYPGILKWTNLTPKQIETRVLKIKGFKGLASEFGKKYHKIMDLADRLGLVLTVPKKTKATGKKLAGAFITFTGVRDKLLQEYIEDQGGTVQSMRTTTTILVIKDDSYSNAKTIKAEQSGIQVLTVDQFR
jgi:NAD-dependent DNA ligase